MDLERSDLVGLGKNRIGLVDLLPLSKMCQIGLPHPDSAQFHRPWAVDSPKGDNDNIDEEMKTT